MTEKLEGWGVEWVLKSWDGVPVYVGYPWDRKDPLLVSPIEAEFYGFKEI